MDNNWNFKTLGAGLPGAMNRLPVSTPLSRQGSLYSWTLDQIQNNLGKDCGSMNMEELLMNVCSSEETQGVVPPNGANEGLQRQDSITLPRILSQKTIEEVWKYITEEDTKNDGGRTNIPQIQRQQQTLGDITLEEFLIRSGGCYIHDPSSSISGNLKPSSSEKKPMVSDVLNNIVPRNRNQMQQLYGSKLHPNGNVFMSTYHPQQNQMQPQQHIMSKPHGYGYTSGHGIRDSFMGIGDQENNISLVPSIAAVPGGAMSVNTCSPVTSYPLLDGIPKINVGSSLVSPFAYTISASEWRRNSGVAAEKKLVEKTQRRMIKNRESAARSRARKQAQSMELEAEVEKLRKENHELLKKQAEMSKMQTKLGKGMINRSKKQLRRTKSDIQ